MKAASSSGAGLSGILGSMIGPVSYTHLDVYKRQVFEDTTLSETTDFIAGHPDWCTRVHEWSVNVHLQDLSGSGKYIGASAVPVSYTHLR